MNKAYNIRLKIATALCSALCTAMFAVIPIQSALAASPLQTPDAGQIDRIILHSPELNEDVTIDVWTPADYAQRADSLPVIYMHDGQNLFDATTTWNQQAWEMDSVTNALQINGEIALPPVIVGIHSVQKTRTGDLMPVKALADYDPKTAGFNEDINLRGDQYAAFVAQTLKPQIDSLYRVRRQPASTSVMGSSMGGLMSAYILCEYPEIFGNAACLSTHWAGFIKDNKADDNFGNSLYLYLQSNLPRDGKHRIYFDRGTETIDALYDYWDDKIIEMTESAGYTRPDKLDSFVDKGAAHDERSWSQRVERPLKFLLKLI